MKKIIKTLIPSVGILALIPTCISLTGCNTSTPAIDIKQNKNVKIECPQITQGQDLTITYALDEGYVIDVSNSSITFRGTVENKINLLLCIVDEEAKTIKIEGKYVTADKITIDIKAENKASSVVTQEQFDAAFKLITDVSEDRNFISNGYSTDGYFDEKGGFVPLGGWADCIINAKGTKDRCYVKAIHEGQEFITMDKYSEPNIEDKVGYKTYCYHNDLPSKLSNKTYLEPWVCSESEYMFRGFKSQLAPTGKLSDCTKYQDLNVYYRNWDLGEGETAHHYTTFVVFDALHKLSFLGNFFLTEGMGPEPGTKVTVLGFENFPIEYGKAINMDIPEKYVAAQTMYYDQDNFKIVDHKLECKVKYIDGTTNAWTPGAGRYVIPMSWKGTYKDVITIKFDGITRNDWKNYNVVLSQNNKALVAGQDYTYDSTTGVTKINKSSIDTTKDLIFVWGDYQAGPGESSWGSSIKLIVE